MNWRYRIKKEHFRSGMSREWVKCSEEEALKVQRMRPNQFEVEQIKEPELTPSMKAAGVEEVVKTDTSTITVTKRKPKKTAKKKK